MSSCRTTQEGIRQPPRLHLLTADYWLINLPISPALIYIPSRYFPELTNAAHWLYTLKFYVGQNPSTHFPVIVIKNEMHKWWYSKTIIGWTIGTQFFWKLNLYVSWNPLYPFPVMISKTGLYEWSNGERGELCQVVLAKRVLSITCVCEVYWTRWAETTKPTGDKLY